MDFSGSIFHGLYFSISLSNESLSFKKVLTDTIKILGGTVVVGLPKETTHLLTGSKEITELSFKVKAAIKNGCWVVLPSFITESYRCNSREDEWNHTIIDGRAATLLAPNANCLVENAFSRALYNINNVTISAGVVEHSFQTALDNISGLCAQLLLRHGISITHRLSPLEMVSKTHVALKTPKVKLTKIQENLTEKKLGSYSRKSRSPFSATSTFTNSVTTVTPLTPISQTFTYKPKEPRKTFYSSDRPTVAMNLLQQKKRIIFGCSSRRKAENSG